MGKPLTVHNYILDEIKIPFGELGVSNVYGDIENIMKMQIVPANTGILHLGSTVYSQSIGIGNGEYTAEYYIIWIKHKMEAGLNIDNQGQNIADLDNFVTLMNNQLEDSAGDTEGHPYGGKTPLLMEFGIGNEEDPIGLPGGDSKSWKGLLIFFAKYDITYWNEFSCRT